MLEFIVGYAALRIIGNAINKQELADLKFRESEPRKTVFDLIREEREEEERLERKAKRDAELAAWEIKNFGCTVQKDADGRMVKFDGGILLDNGLVYRDK